MKLAIVDLDGVVADSTERFKRAEESKQSFHAYAQRMKQAGNTQGWQVAELERQEENVYWQTAFNPDLVALDVLIEGVDNALYHLEKETGYHIVFLTSRPESMRQATVAWLHESIEKSLMSYEVVMKPPAFQFVKTVTWKAGTIQMLHRLYEADELLFIDDEEANRRAVLDAYPDGGDFGIVRVVESLAKAVDMP